MIRHIILQGFVAASSFLTGYLVCFKLSNKLYPKLPHISGLSDNIVIDGQINKEMVQKILTQFNNIEHDKPLDIIINSLGGDGECALVISNRIAGCKNFTRAIVPHGACSAGLIIAFGCKQLHFSNYAVISPIDIQKKDIFGTCSLTAYIKAVKNIDWRVSLSEALEAVNYQRLLNKYELSIKYNMRINNHCDTEDEINTVYEFLTETYPHDQLISVGAIKRRGLKILPLPEEYLNSFLPVGIQSI